MLGLLTGCGPARHAPGDSGVPADAPETDADADDADTDVDESVDADEDASCPPDMVLVPGTGWCIDAYECELVDAVAVATPGREPAHEITPREAELGCTNAGKALCAVDVWMAACSAGGARLYPYGDEYDPDQCNGGNGRGRVIPTGALVGCEGGFAGIFDMSGNVHEWTVATDGIPGYRLQGGDFSSLPNMMTCELGGVFGSAAELEGTGFRCCLELDAP